MKKRIVILTSVAALVILSGIVAWLAVPRSLPEKKILEAVAERVDLQVKNVHYTEVGEGDTKWEVKADTARYIKKDNLALFDKVHVRLLQADGSFYVLTGDRGKLNMETKDIEIAGRVAVVSSSGDRFTTETLNYASADGRFFTDAPIRMENPKMDVRGVGLTFSVKQKELTLQSHVRARIRMS